MPRYRFCLLLLTAAVGVAASANVRAQETAPGTLGRPKIADVETVGELVLAATGDRIQQSEGWVMGGGGRDGGSRNRYYWPLHVRTNTPGATLTLDFQGRGIAAVFHTPRVRAYGSHWKDGLVKATVDDKPPKEFIHDQEALEVVLADGLQPGKHRLVFEHVQNGCTLFGFRVFDRPVGHIEGVLRGDSSDYLFDVRLSVWRGEQLIRTGLHRNWLSGKYRITGLPPGDDLRLQVEAVGWTAEQVEHLKVEAGKTTVLGDIHLKQ